MLLHGMNGLGSALDQTLPQHFRELLDTTVVRFDYYCLSGFTCHSRFLRSLFSLFRVDFPRSG
ncbi:hypothetical protein [Streptomyces sp. NPDC101150]|uniref:hypothetical protein n=1 Tax=Streptomyces sp. NPDC101150 TaxID=3366114 RepID=UPI0037F7226F